MKKLTTSLLALSILTTSVFANTNIKHKNVEQIKSQSLKKERNKLRKENSVIKRAVYAVKYTQLALFYLNKNKKEEAIKSIKHALKELQILSIKNHAELLPVSSNIEIYKFAGDIKTAKELIKKVKNEVAHNKFPAARNTLEMLRDEIDIYTLNLPIATYPATLKMAEKYLKEGKIKVAKDLLRMALTTLVIIKNEVPLGIINAKGLIIAASKLIKEDKRKNKELALKYLEEAEKQLKLSNILGYTSTSSTTYKELENKIEYLMKEIKQENNTSSLFKELILKIKEFGNKAIKHFEK